MLYKSTGYRVKDLDAKQGIIQMYWSAFGNEDDGGDIVVPGAFTKSIAEWGPGSKQPRIKYLWQHDSSQLLGVPSQLVQDDIGLLATAQIVQTTLGQDVLLLYEADVVTEHSIGYETVKSTFDRASMARLLQEVKLYEGSAVTWGMNSQTPTVAVKSLTDAAKITDRRDRLHKLLHDAPLKTEMVAARLADELKALDELLARLQPATPAREPVVVITTTGGTKASGDALSALQSMLAGDAPAEGKAQAMPDETKPARRTRRPAKDAKRAKARDFQTVYNTDRDPWDLLEDLDDMWEALRESITGVLIEGSASDGDNATLATSLSQFAEAVTGWVQMAEVQDCWGDIADSMEEAQDRAADYYGSSFGPYYYMSAVAAYAAKHGHAIRSKASARLAAAPDAPEAVKAGAAISQSNRDILTKAANGIAAAMGDMKTHHKSLADLLEKTLPQAEDEAATGETGADAAAQNDDGKGGKSAATHTAPDRANAGTTRTSELLSELDALVARHR
jgi:HK97 family phage prohead protease